MLSFVLLVAALFPTAWASQVPSPSAGGDLICHTDDPSECYPKIFQPTEEFQIIRDDQDIPPNLHVRMNIWSGVKEARLNIPGAEEDPALAGMPVDRAVVVVEPDQPVGEDGAAAEDKAKPRQDAPAYDPVGKIKPPAGGAEPQFADALNLFRKLGYNPDDETDKTATVDGALEELRELSHDGYYGMMIMSDKDVVKGLLCLMLPEEGDEVVNRRDQAAAYVIAGALSNNPKAVKELAANWDAITQSSCKPSSGKIVERLYAGFSGSEPSSMAATAKARIAALNGMLEDPAIRDEFLGSGGMRELLEVLAQAQRHGGSSEGGDEWETAARRAGQLVLDRFLDEEMGATLGVWPRVEMLGEGDCKSGASRDGAEECWRYVVGRAQERGSGDWSRDLWERLGMYDGKGSKDSKEHFEL